MVEDDPTASCASRGERTCPSPSWPLDTVLLGSPSPRRLSAAFPPGLDGGAGLAAQEVTIAEQATTDLLQQRLLTGGCCTRFLSDNSSAARLERSESMRSASVPPWKPPSSRHCPPGVSYAPV